MMIGILLVPVDLDEMIGEGNVTLLRCVDTFGCDRGIRFTTYACVSIARRLWFVAKRSMKYQRRFPRCIDDVMLLFDLPYVHASRDGDWDEVHDLQDIMARNAAGLNAAEARVIESRYGLCDGRGAVRDEPQTLERIGHRMGITRERVRQIHDRALPKLRRAIEAASRLRGGTLVCPAVA